MRTIKIVECQADMNKFREMLDAHVKYGCSDENPTEEGVFVAPNVGKEFADLPWLVFDNRGHQGYLEDFETLDGALSYATDGHTCCDRQHEWDNHGRFFDELSERCRWLKDEPDELREVGVDSERLKETKEATMKKWEKEEEELFEAVGEKARKRDRFVTSMDENDDVEELERAFVDSVINDVNGVHSVEFPSLGGTPHVRVTFRNEAGQTVSVDGILERFNMLNWRRICDRFAEMLLLRTGKKPNEFDWPTPNVRVEYRASADENDVITSVSLVWGVDYETRDALMDAMIVLKSIRAAEEIGANREEVIELCPNCDREARFKLDAEAAGYKTTCPYCRKTLLLCDACHQAGKDDHCDKCNTELKKEESKDGRKDEGREEEIFESCSKCEEEFHIFWNIRKDGYAVHCPYCGAEQRLCTACRETKDGRDCYGKCTYGKDGKCMRAD